MLLLYNVMCLTMLCFCYAELNFTVAFLLIRKAWDDWFAGKVGDGVRDFKNWGDPSNGGLTLKWGGRGG